MQISAANLLVASQQPHAGKQPSAAKSFEAALKGAGAQPAKFAPMSFDEIAGAEAAPAANVQPKPSAAPLPPGSQLNIRV